jgi:hypothetical protein
VHFNWFPILYSDRGFFVVSLEVENERENIEVAIVIKNRIEDRLEHVFIPYTSNKKIENHWRCYYVSCLVQCMYPTFTVGICNISKFSLQYAGKPVM